VSVVVPALNEGRNIREVLARIPDDVYEVILVDGGSRDNTVKAARETWPALRVLMQPRRGKGDAITHGCRNVRGDIIVMLDADGSARPEEIPRFVKALTAGADLAKGSRFLPGGGSADITRFRALGNRFLTGLVNVLFGSRYTDLCYGYNAFWTRAFDRLELDVEGFEIETQINVRALSAGLAVVEVASHEDPRLSGVSNLNAFRDGSRVLRTILREFTRPNRDRVPGREPTPEEA
jgi:glycosyltransferase involved in cell wall biosynthesis